MEDFLGIALRVTVIYFYALLILRLSGKRSLDTLTPLDFIVGVIIGDMFDDIIWAEVPLAQGLVGLTTVVLVHSLTAVATWKNQRLHDLLVSTPRPVIRQGKFLDKALAQERTPSGEVEMQLRLLGEDKLEEIKEACWEPSGELSVEIKQPAKPAQKRDRPALPKVA